MKAFQLPTPNIDLKPEVVTLAAATLALSLAGNSNLYRKIFSCIDLTTLSATDTKQQVDAMCNKVLALEQQFNELPFVGAVCVYPAMVEAAAARLGNSAVGVASVAGGFPASQTFLEIKKSEIEMVVAKGATEIDIVMPVGLFLSGNYDEVFNEIQVLKQASKSAKLKVIIESGALKTPELIYKAAHLCMQAGADFIKTSTGKEFPGASIEAAYIMTTAIKEHFVATGKRIGFKPAGGISTPDIAVMYYAIVHEVLGEEWLDNKMFRIGASRLANNLISAILNKEIVYF